MNEADLLKQGLDEVLKGSCLETRQLFLALDATRVALASSVRTGEGDVVLASEIYEDGGISLEVEKGDQRVVKALTIILLSNFGELISQAYANGVVRGLGIRSIKDPVELQTVEKGNKELIREAWVFLAGSNPSIMEFLKGEMVHEGVEGEALSDTELIKAYFAKLAGQNISDLEV